MKKTVLLYRIASGLALLLCLLAFSSAQGREQKKVPPLESHESYYSGKGDYREEIKETGFSAEQILKMGVARFRDVFSAQYRKREGREPTISQGDEKAELIFLALQRQDNQRRLARLPLRYCRQLEQVDTALRKLENDETIIRLQLTGGGSGWLGFMRDVGLRHQALFAHLLRASPSNKGKRVEARVALRRAIAELRQMATKEARKIKDLPDDELYTTPTYHRALARFQQELTELERLTESSLSTEVLWSLSRYLPDCWWEHFDKTLRREAGML